MNSTAVTSKGQVTIPQDVRRQLGIRQGSRIAFKIKGDCVELRIAGQPPAASSSGYGLIKTAKKPAPVDFDAANLYRRSKP